MGEQKSNFGLQGGDTIHKGILEFVLYYIRFDLQGGGFPPLSPPNAHLPNPLFGQRLLLFFLLLLRVQAMDLNHFVLQAAVWFYIVAKKPPRI